MTRTLAALLAAALVGAGVSSTPTARAEEAVYGAVELTGLARRHWPLNKRGLWNAMVCNVNGPDGWLAIRSGPGTGFRAVRKLNRLAVLTIDTRDVKGPWVRVVDAYRNHTPNGRNIGFKSLTVSGWAHSRYLCDFLD